VVLAQQAAQDHEPSGQGRRHGGDELLLGDGALDLLTHPQMSECQERHAPARVVAIRGDQQADHAGLVQVLAVHAPGSVAARLPTDDVEVLGDQQFSPSMPAAFTRPFLAHAVSPPRCSRQR
jgi:hypothetical protein